VTGWRGLRGPYDSLYALSGDRGGGLEISRLRRGLVRPMVAGPFATGGGLVPSTAEALTGYGGCSGPGPGALIGLGGR
jgi:hypothetical protein